MLELIFKYRSLNLIFYHGPCISVITYSSVSKLSRQPDIFHRSRYRSNKNSHKICKNFGFVPKTRGIKANDFSFDRRQPKKQRLFRSKG